MIESTVKDGVAVLVMRHGKANALDTELCQALCGALDDAAAEGAAVVVLTDVGRRGVLGRGGPQVGDCGAGGVRGYLPAGAAARLHLPCGLLWADQTCERPAGHANGGALPSFR